MLLHSLRLRIQSNSFDFGGWPEVLYQENDLRNSFPAHAGTLSLQIERRRAAQALAVPPIHGEKGTFSEISLLGGMCWFSGGRFYSRANGEFASETEFDPARGSMRTILDGRYRDVGADAVLALVVKQIMQSFVLPFFRLKFLHGAVVARDGATVMITGAGGAGKSTAALRLLADGYTLLSDDGPLFTHCDGTTWALSSLDFAQVTEKTLELLPYLREGIVGAPDHRGKYRIPAHRFQPDDSWRRPHRVTHIVQLERRPCSVPTITELRPVGAAGDMMSEAMTVFRSSVFGGGIFRDHSRFSFDVISDLWREARVFGLEIDDGHLGMIPALIGEIANG